MITKGELWQLLKWTLLWIFSWFVAFNIREILETYLPTPEKQIIFGIAGLLFVAWVWDIRKYNGGR